LLPFLPFIGISLLGATTLGLGSKFLTGSRILGLGYILKSGSYLSKYSKLLSALEMINKKNIPKELEEILQLLEILLEKEDEESINENIKEITQKKIEILELLHEELNKAIINNKTELAININNSIRKIWKSLLGGIYDQTS